MAVYGPVRHQRNIIWTEASVIWQYMDRSVTKKILYGPQLYGSIWTQKILHCIWTEASEVHIIFFW
jgi:hypothetical protein